MWSRWSSSPEVWRVMRTGRSSHIRATLGLVREVATPVGVRTRRQRTRRHCLKARVRVNTTNLHVSSPPLNYGTYIRLVEIVDVLKKVEVWKTVWTC